MLWYVCENSSSDPRLNQFYSADYKESLGVVLAHIFLSGSGIEHLGFTGICANFLD